MQILSRPVHNTLVAQQLFPDDIHGIVRGLGRQLVSICIMNILELEIPNGIIISTVRLLNQQAENWSAREHRRPLTSCPVFLFL